MRVFVDPENISEGTVTITDKNDIHHMLRVMRLKEGDAVDVSDKTEWEYSCRISETDSSYIKASVIKKERFMREPDIMIDIYQGIPKAGKMETIVQKCVELGADSIIPVWTERTVVTDKGNFGKKIQRWQKVSDEAVKQCRRGKIPGIGEPLKMEELAGRIMKKTDGYDIVILAFENEYGTTIKDCMEGLEKKPVHIAVIIGPEGGISDREAGMLKDAGAVPVSLGKTILRTETAGPAAVAMLMYALEL